MDIENSLKALVKSGLTQRELGDALGCSQAHVSDMLNGKAGLKRPSAKIVAGIDRLERLRKVFATSSDKAQRQDPLKQLGLLAEKSSPKETSPAPPAPAIPIDLQSAAVMLKGLSGKFADEDSIAWFLQLPPKHRSEVFEVHECITTAICVGELIRVQALRGEVKK